MTYTAGTMPTSSNPAQDYMTMLDLLLVAGGFTFIEERTASTTTSRIYKSPGASNSFGQDWFYVIKRDSNTGTNVYIGVSEQYDTGTHRMMNPTPYGNTNLTPTAQFAYNIPAGLDPTTNLSPGSHSIGSSGYQYWISINPSRVILASRVGVNEYAHYAGLYDDLLSPAVSPFPLCAMVPGYANSQSASVGSTTREPNTTTAQAYNFYVHSYGAWTPLTVSSPELYNPGKYPVSRVIINSAKPYPAPRGLLKDLLHSPITGASGDTLNVPIGGGKTYVRIYPGSGSGTAGPVFMDTTA